MGLLAFGKDGAFVIVHPGTMKNKEAMRIVLLDVGTVRELAL